MADIYKLQYNGMTLAYPGWNGYVSWENAPAFYTLSLETDGHGTLSAETLTGYAGDTVTLAPTYNTYYRFSGYDCTGGTIEGNTFTFGMSDATAKAFYKLNTFTASGGWEKGSDVTVTSQRTAASTNVPAKYATTSYHTSNVPAEWYNTSNRWKVTSTVSAYQITLKPTMTFRYYRQDGYKQNTNAAATAISLIGSTTTQSQNFSRTYQGSNPGTFVYSKNFTSNTTGVNYGISAKLFASGWYGGGSQKATQQNVYSAAKTTGTWVATGIIP